LTRRPVAALGEVVPVVREAIERGDLVRLTVTGGSMRPFIPSGAVVELTAAPPGGCAPGQVVLVEESPGRHLLHRVRRRSAGGVWTRGDANADDEGPFPDARVVARVAGIVRDGRVVPLDAGMRGLLARLWNATPAGPLALLGWDRARRGAGRALRRAGLLPPAAGGSRGA
jgi:signal peptidase I